MAFEKETIEKLSQICVSYSEAVGVNCGFIDNKGNTIFSHFINTEKKSFCRYIHTHHTSKDYCVPYHLHGGKDSTRFGGEYIYYCPFGFYQYTSPIVIGGVIEGYIVAGTVLMKEPDNTLYKFIYKKLGIEENQSEKEKVKRLIDEVPVVNPKRLNSLAKLLFTQACHISDIDTVKYLELKNTAILEEEDNGNSVLINKISKKQIFDAMENEEIKETEKLIKLYLKRIYTETGANLSKLKAECFLLASDTCDLFEPSKEIKEELYQFFSYLISAWDYGEVANRTANIIKSFASHYIEYKNNPYGEDVSKAISYIRANYMDKVTLESTANKIGLSSGYLCRKFKQETKENFSEYLTKLRIKEAKALVLSSDIDMVEIANKCGFDSQSYFIQTFKNQEGVTPGNMRKNLKNFKKRM